MLARLAVAVALAAFAGGAGAQPAASTSTMGERITGAVKSVDERRVVISTASGDVEVTVSPQTRVLHSEPATAAEIKAGGYLGTANVTGPDGGTATEVHLMDATPNVHAPMNADGALMMTNGRVKSVRTTAKGEEMEVDYGTGVRHVTVPANTPVTRMVGADVASLKVGAAVTAVMPPGAGREAAAAFIVPMPAK